MKRLHFVLALALYPLALPALAQQPAKTAAAAGPLVTVNGVAIPRQRFEVLMKQQLARGAQDNEQLRAQVRDALINNELLIQEANRSGLSKKPEVLQQVDMTRQEVIANAMVSEYLRLNPVTDADLQKEYDRAKAQTGDREYRARHILLKTDDEAKAAIADIKKGAKFEDVALKRSIDEGSKVKGGDLDWNVPSNFDKAFADAMVKLEKGKMTDAPVPSRFGFHVILLEDVRPVNFPPFSQVKQQLQQRVVGQKVDHMIRELRAKAKVE
ncbi:MAG TPA: peptidyl-prolyl cis-trans isomerase [Burkholderiales bacterium]|nr:peptidyl-prolyl cis-trans isomerase [Burkholderiales bacterium]